MSETSTPFAKFSASTASRTTATLRVRTGDVVQTLDVPLGASLLQIAVEADTALNFVCCRGVCGACLIRVASPDPNLSSKTPAEQKLLAALDASAEHRLACQCSILDDAEIEPVDESTVSQN